jgi:hypothetical protein
MKPITFPARTPAGLIRLLPLAWLALCVAGCQSFKPPAASSLASISVTGRSLTDIWQATTNVFADHGFTTASTAPYRYVFEHPGSRMNNLAYASYTLNEMVTVRVEIDLQPRDTTTVISCNAWLVEDANDPPFEDEHRVRKLRKWPYEQLLKDIREQLK